MDSQEFQQSELEDLYNIGSVDERPSQNFTLSKHKSLQEIHVN